MTNSFTLLGELFDEEGLPWRSCPQFCFLLQWRHNACHGVPNHRYLNCLLTRLFRPRLNKHLSSASLVFVRGNHRWPVQSRRKGPVTRKMLPSSCVSGNSVARRFPHTEIRWCKALTVCVFCTHTLSSSHKDWPIRSVEWQFMWHLFNGAGPLYTERTGDLPQDLVKSRSRDIRV